MALLPFPPICDKTPKLIREMTHLSILNIAAYHFVVLDDAELLKTQLGQWASELGLKGTILLATEGINLFLAGTDSNIQTFTLQLQADSRFANMTIKRSWSRNQPFKKLLVKVKAEIIRMNHPTIQPSFDPQSPVRAPSVDAKTLRRWLDQGFDDNGNPVVMLDTRNDFEVDYGTFDDAVDWRIKKFSDFPAAFETNKAALAGKTVVSFCTGGIRCEKAAIYMRETATEAGIASVYQLDGGILKYFEETQEPANSVAAPHYRGACFVFDQREALGGDLKPSDFGDDSRFAPPLSSPAPSAFPT